MANSISAEVWLDERRWDALEAVLEEQGASIEKYLQDYLVDLYQEMVPPEGAARGRSPEGFLCVPPVGAREKPLHRNRISEGVPGRGPASSA